MVLFIIFGILQIISGIVAIPLSLVTLNFSGLIAAIWMIIDGGLKIAVGKTIFRAKRNDGRITILETKMAKLEAGGVKPANNYAQPQPAQVPNPIIYFKNANLGKEYAVVEDFYAVGGKQPIPAGTRFVLLDALEGGNYNCRITFRGKAPMNTKINLEKFGMMKVR